MNWNEGFRKFSTKAANALGSSWLFVLSFFLIVAWLLTGPFAHFSDTWQLLINTSTTIFTFLAVFLIQNTQNRDAKAMHLKLDELIHAVHGARNKLVDLEDLSDEELERLQEQFKRMRHSASDDEDEEESAVADESEEEMASEREELMKRRKSAPNNKHATRGT